MQRTKSRPRWVAWAALFLGLALLWGAIALLPVHGERAIYGAVIRLHVIANSDSEEDQALKLRVRDAVLALASERLAGCGDRDEAQARLGEMLSELEAEAARVVAEAGRTDAVRVMLGEEEYPRRDYETFCFPSGRYLSLRVMIGEAQGQNFWCVLFPPLCMSAASVSQEQAEEEFIAVGLSKDQYAVITETDKTKYKIRFRLLEVLGEVFGRD